VLHHHGRVRARVKRAYTSKTGDAREVASVANSDHTKISAICELRVPECAVCERGAPNRAICVRIEQRGEGRSAQALNDRLGRRMTAQNASIASELS